MNKHELVVALAEHLSITQTQSLEIVNAWEEVVTASLCEDKRIILQGFGSFSIWSQTSRMGRNPRTGEACPIKARMSVKFKPGKKLMQNLNKKKDNGKSTKEKQNEDI